MPNPTINTYSDNIEAHIEIPAFAPPIKYEINKDTNKIFVDRFLEVAMYYPCNYGYIPETLGGDGDPLDILVITPYPLLTGVGIYCRPIGTLNMTDESGEDTKVLAVPTYKLTRAYANVHSIEDLEKLQPTLLPALRHFFEHYKDLDEGKWVKLQDGWGTPEEAQKVIMEGVLAYQHNKE